MYHIVIQAGVAKAWGHHCPMLLYRLGWQGPRITSVSCCYTDRGGKGLGSYVSHVVIQAGVAKAWVIIVPCCLLYRLGWQGPKVVSVSC